MNDISKRELELDKLSATFKELKDGILRLKNVKSEYSQSAIILLRNVFINRMLKPQPDNGKLPVLDVNVSTLFKLIGHSGQIADTGDYDGYYEITDGKVSLLTKDDDDEVLQPIVDALNNSGCKFYQDDWFEFENKILKDENERLKFMIENGLGWRDMENDISPTHII